MEEQQENTATYHGASETTHGLHTVHHTLVFPTERKHCQGIGCNVLGSRSDERDDNQCQDGIEIRLEIEQGHREDEDGINQLGRENPALVIARGGGVSVDNRRPKELDNPRQFDELQQPDGREGKVLLAHHHRDDRREEAHRNGLGDVQTKECG